jgi:hypothetical protein
VAMELLGVNSIVEVLDWDRRTLIAFIILCQGLPGMNADTMR